MRIAILETLDRLDSIFEGGEPEAHYQRRRRSIVKDDYDFGSNGCTDAYTFSNSDYETEVLTYAFKLRTDCAQYREVFRTMLNKVTWANLSNEGKDEAIRLHLKEDSVDDATDGSNKIGHLIATGQASDIPSGRAFLVRRWAEFHVRDKESAYQRVESVRLYEVVGTYLSVSDATDFFRSVELLFLEYEKQAIKGTSDYSFVDALFNYIESTVGSIYENSGLESKGYTMQNGDADMNNFISDLMDVLRHGIY